jgi:hypothetical protein
MPAYTRISADLLTDTHRMTCRIEAGNWGTFGMLNDSNASVFPVEDAYISRLGQPAKIIEHYPALYVAKATLSLVLIARREELGPLGLARGGYTHITPFPVLIMTTAFEIHGQLEQPGKLDVSALLGTGTGKFISAYNVTVTATAYPDIPYTSEVLVINRGLITLIAPEQGGKTGG